MTMQTSPDPVKWFTIDSVRGNSFPGRLPYFWSLGNISVQWISINRFPI